MTINEIEARMAAIAEEIDSASAEQVAALSAEVDQLCHLAGYIEGLCCLTCKHICLKDKGLVSRYASEGPVILRIT